MSPQAGERGGEREVSHHLPLIYSKSPTLRNTKTTLKEKREIVANMIDQFAKEPGL